MNLVAKEYVACRFENDGALVLSEFAGAAEELRQAWLINPYDINGMKSALLEAYHADGRDVTRRMKAMRKQVMEHDVAAWADSFLNELTAAQPGHGKIGAPRAGGVVSPHGPRAEAGPGGVGSRKRCAPAVVRRARRPAADAADPDRGRHAARGVPLPAVVGGAQPGRSGAAGDAVGGAGDLLRPAPRLLPDRALRRERAPDVPRGVRHRLLPRPQPRARALGAGRGPGCGSRGVAARRRPAGARRRLEPGRDLRDARGRRLPRPADRVAVGDRRRRST